MAVITIPWQTGSGNIYLTCDSTTGTQTVQVSSDANPLYVTRSQTINFVAGNKSAALTVRQQPLGASYDNSFDLSFVVNGD